MRRLCGTNICTALFVRSCVSVPARAFFNIGKIPLASNNLGTGNRSVYNNNVTELGTVVRKSIE
jgi:hypothetical protein